MALPLADGWVYWLYIILRLPRGGGFISVLRAALCCSRFCSFCKRCSSLAISMHSRPVGLSSLHPHLAVMK